MRVVSRVLLPLMMSASGVLAAYADAQTYITAFSDSQWKAQSGAFACSLSHEIAAFGSARLVRNAGSAEVLEIKAKGSNLRVGLAARNFSAAFASYKACVKNLIPYTFDQLSRTQLSYTREAEDLSPAAKAELDKIVRYVKADQKVLGIIIDAHSDKLPKQEESDALSQRQAEFVTRYLIEKGIAADNITTRWHGDKFPIANNQNKAGQAKNRRVTVRLESEQTRKEMEKKIAAIKEAEQKAAAEKAAKDATEKTDPGINPAELEKLTEQQNLSSGKQPEIGLPR